MIDKRPLVLLADDSMVVRAVIRGQLADIQCELIEAADGDEALARVRADHPDVVLLDVEMPGRTGYQVLEAMQADPGLAHVPVVFLSGRVTADDVATGLKLGAHDYLRKPVEPGELIARLSAALRSKELHDRLRRDNAHLREIAPVDSLTGALDVRGLQQYLRELASQSRSTGLAVGAVLFDVDGLASINDRYGWDRGDQVLQEVAARISRFLDADQALGRCGPDEFLALFPGADGDEIARIADQLRALVHEAPHQLDGDLVTVSVAVGAASVPDGDPAQLLATLQREIVLQKDGAVPEASELDPEPELDLVPRLEAVEAAPAPPPPPSPDPASQEPRRDGLDSSRLLDQIRQRTSR